MKCKFAGCESEAYQEEDDCILHVDLPSKGDDLESIKELKEKEVVRKISAGDLNFKGAKFFDVNLSGMHIPGDLVMTQAVVLNDFHCLDSEIDGGIWFDQGRVGGHAFFESSLIRGSISFFKGKVGGNISFDRARVDKYVWFEGVTVDGEASFNHCYLGSSISFNKAIIDENVSFYGSTIEGNAWFEEAYLGGNTWFDLVEIRGALCFKDTKFKYIKSQERACRSAKILWERLGDRGKADYHFYREMEAKRKQKGYLSRYLELIVQYPFGYGVRPFRLILTFIGIMIAFALFYWVAEGIFTTDMLMDKLRFSFLTMLIPAYGVINAQTGMYGWLTIFEAFIGAFTWPTFMVIFARKYMR
jgi:Pentapeptide repeats (9 copies)